MALTKPSVGMLDMASQAQAQAGTAEDVVMNPLRTAEAIDAQVPVAYASLIEAQTASDDTVLDFVTGIGAHAEYILTGFLQPATDDVQLALQFSDDAGATFEVGYQFFGQYHSQAGAAVTDFGSGSNEILIGDDTAAGMIGNGAAEGIWFMARIINTQVAARNKLVRGQCTYVQADGGTKTGDFGAAYSGGSVINGFRLKFSGGNIASGTARLLGVNI